VLKIIVKHVVVAARSWIRHDLRNL